MALLTCCCCALGLHAEHVLFEIGKQNGSPSEFALYPDRYKQFLIDFSGVKRYAEWGIPNLPLTGLTPYLARKTAGEAAAIGQATIRATFPSLTSSWQDIPLRVIVS